MSYMAGQLVLVTGQFIDKQTTSQYDPGIVKLRVKTGLQAPGESTTYVYGDDTGFITRASTGLYTAELPTRGKPGTWVYEWIAEDGGGDTEGINAVSFIVLPAPL